MSCTDQADNCHDADAVRKQFGEAGDGAFWRGIEEFGPPEEHPEEPGSGDLPAQDPTQRRGMSRRDLFKMMGASAALAGLTACTKLPLETIVPYVNPPEIIKPGEPLFYASSMPWRGVAQGVLVWSFMGRPTKIEGNNDHPGSMGRANVFMQASVLDLYDPDRSQVLLQNGRVGDWNDFIILTEELRAKHLRNKGEGLRFLTGTITSPTLGDQLHDLLTQFPHAQWHQHDPTSRDNVRAGAQMAFGEVVETVYRFDQANVVVGLDADPFFAMPGGVRYAWDFGNKRRVARPDSSMNRFYAVEAIPTISGTQADHRLRLRPSEVETFARLLAQAVGVNLPGLESESLPGVSADWLAALVKDLQQQKGASLIVAGDSQPPVVHALAHAMNAQLGNVGKTVYYTNSIEVNPVIQAQSFRQLVSDMEAGKVETLIILGENPVYTAPADVPFAEELPKVPTRIYLGNYEDETSVLCNWHVPAAHYLESWGDLRAYDGAVSMIQPLIAPLYQGKTASEILTFFQGQPGRTCHTIVQEYWQSQNPKLTAQQFGVQWEIWLAKGIIAGTAFPARTVALSKTFNVARTPDTSTSSGLEIAFKPDPSVWDGSYTNNGWLQELAQPFSKLVWDNAVMVSPATAERLRRAKTSLGDPPQNPVPAGAPSIPRGLWPANSTALPNAGEEGEYYNAGETMGMQNAVVELKHRGRMVSGPLLIMPGMADNCIVVTLGYGRTRAGRYGTGVGFNAYSIRTADRPWIDTGSIVGKTPRRHKLVTLQRHNVIGPPGKEEDAEAVAAFRRNLVRVATMDEYRGNPNFAKDAPDMTSDAQSLYPVLPSPYDFKKGPQWGMSIDLSSCIGCNACIIACQSENNSPVVGKDQCARGREMHWIRVDTYFRGNVEQPEFYNEVLPCMQCENAPCEYVCPVGATMTGPEGINQMIYNRCVGTRYCSNNCPYKVRRFNFYLYSDWTTPSFYAQKNPWVTVRSRGVMEKCTYCIQRIRWKEIKAEVAGTEVKDGEILTACQQTCPTNAIVFGDIRDPNSAVSKVKAQSRKYGLLEELNTRPRTTYLAKIWNPNPEIGEPYPLPAGVQDTSKQRS